MLGKDLFCVCETLQCFPIDRLLIVSSEYFENWRGETLVGGKCKRHTHAWPYTSGGYCSAVVCFALGGLEILNFYLFLCVAHSFIVTIRSDTLWCICVGASHFSIRLVTSIANAATMSNVSPPSLPDGMTPALRVYSEYAISTHSERKVLLRWWILVHYPRFTTSKWIGSRMVTRSKCVQIKSTGKTQARLLTWWFQTQLCRIPPAPELYLCHWQGDIASLMLAVSRFLKLLRSYAHGVF